MKCIRLRAALCAVLVRGLTTAVAVAALVLSSSPAGIAGSVRTVALTGQSAPTGLLGTTFGAMTPGFAINAQGQIAFMSYFRTNDGPNSPSLNGVFAETSEGLRLVMREGQILPGASGPLTRGDFSPSVWDLSFSDAGHVAFAMRKSFRSEPPGNAAGVVWRNGAIERFAVDDTPAVGFPNGWTFRGATDVWLNQRGEVAFEAAAWGPPLDPLFPSVAGGWTYRDGVSERVVRVDESLPGDPAGPPVFSASMFGSESSRIAYQAVTRHPTTFDLEQSTWIREGADHRRLLPTVANTAGLQPNHEIQNRVGDVSLNGLEADGRAWLEYLSTDRDDPSIRNFGLLREAGAGFEVAWRTGTPAPGTPDGVAFLNRPSGFEQNVPARVNASGRALISWMLEGPAVTSANDFGFWSTRSGTLELVAREGDPAPGLGPGVTLAFDAHSIASAELAPDGRVAFLAQLEGEGVTGRNDQALFAQDPSGVLRLIAREGDMLEVAPGDERRIFDLRFGFRRHPQDFTSTSSRMNGLGEIAFTAPFGGPGGPTSSEGLFVSNAVMVPEPSAAGLAGCALICGLCAAGVRRSREPAAVTPA